jgi:SAM-dependent methyltransferase
MSEGRCFLDRVIATYTPHFNEQSYSDERWLATVGYAECALSLLEARLPAKILDLACGCGASTVVMAQKGFDVTAIDCTPAGIEVARRMSAMKGAHVEWLCQDMRTIEYQQEFDYVCLRDVIFGIFEGPGEDEDLIRRMARATKPGGRCLFEVYDKEFALRHGVEDRLVYDPGTDRFVRKSSEEGSGLSSMRLYSLDQWRRMLAEHGLRIVQVDGWSWPKDPSPPPWRADMIVAQKEPT